MKQLPKLQNLSPNEKTKIFWQLSEIFRKKAIAIALENLEKNDLDKFKNLLLKQPLNQQLVTEFIFARIPNFMELFQSEVEQFSNDFTT